MDMQISMDLEIRYGLWTGYEILILDEMDYGLDLDKDSDPFGPSDHSIEIYEAMVE